MFTDRAALPEASAEGSPGNTVDTWRPSPPTCARRECSLCHGTGWQLVSGSTAAGARRCSCRVLQRLLEIREKARVPTRYETCTLDGYRVANRSQERALEEARRFVERYPAVPRGLLLVGPSGVGKTHLAAAIVRELLDRFEEGLLFCDFPTLLRSGLAVAGASGPAALERRSREHASRWTVASLLVIDGFDTENLAPQWRTQVSALLARRMRAGLPTIVSIRSNAHDERRHGRRRDALEALLLRLRRISISMNGDSAKAASPASLF